MESETTFFSEVSGDVARSTLVTGSDVRRLLCLQRDCYEFRYADQAREHFLTELRSLLRVSVAMVTITRGFERGGPVEMLETHASGFPSDAMKRRVLEAYREAYRDPAIAWLAASPLPRLTRMRREVVSDDEWYGSDFVRKVRLGNGHDDGIYGRRVRRDGSTHVGIGFSRVTGDEPFTLREKHLLEVLDFDSSWMFSSEEGSFEEFPHLARRERETLDLLLGGASEKEAAVRLEISAHTLHTYVKKLYQKFDVTSRAELLAKIFRATQSSKAAE